MTGDREKLTNVIQGDYFISEDPSEVLTTVLGSCIAVCLYDTQRKIGGMNHFLLPSRDGQDGENVRYGAYAMELLINGLLKKGAMRNRLEAKVFGGASMMGNLRDIGASNAKFAHKFLSDEGIPCAAESVGGTSARRIRFWPTSGRVRQLLVTDKVDVTPAVVAPPPPKPANDITLF
ncbi:chemotaxis protein CheD [Tropicibacter naphthalenivorans]|uniref:Probable chemoreceptor glutamine deamidase CheD n=1 Tax=Tropicibacter naphthalenivorans TaxID=441103 RepID=A0A0P1H3H7_9RHOB|nr:chemotaxis protein CheD [Tropicibacter naphthalenivorans]CUH82419.1 Chemoreceptor glutamine deamidase CheD [Tropicibacter naphthalenivorans]SMD06324.1 chemotaxis protein CheD [Tropicibacter naphthalenivorans]